MPEQRRRTWRGRLAHGVFTAFQVRTGLRHWFRLDGRIKLASFYWLARPQENAKISLLRNRLPGSNSKSQNASSPRRFAILFAHFIYFSALLEIGSSTCILTTLRGSIPYRLVTRSATLLSRAMISSYSSRFTPSIDCGLWSRISRPS